ncbi:unnamed protein product [Sphagnum balticum]
MGPAKRRKGKTLALLASYRIEPDGPDEGKPSHDDDDYDSGPPQWRKNVKKREQVGHCASLELQVSTGVS